MAVRPASAVPAVPRGGEADKAAAALEERVPAEVGAVLEGPAVPGARPAAAGTPPSVAMR